MSTPEPPPGAGSPRAEGSHAGLPRVAVIGAGLMGHGIAQEFMAAGAPTSLWDPSPEVLDAVPARIQEHLSRIGSEAEVTLTLAADLAQAVDGADLIVEAIPENMELKREVLSTVQPLAPEAIFASNTSVLRITEIAQNAQRPGLVVGTHWWNPPYLIPLVEVVRGEHTADETVRKTVEWLQAVGKQAVEVHRDVPGFVGNRMQFALVREAAHIVAEGIASPETVDAVVRETMGRRWSAVGPLRNSDYIGLDLVVSIMDYLSPSLASDAQAPEVFQRLLAEGRLGAKTGQGIFQWDPGEREAVEEALVSHLVALRDRDHSDGD